MITLFVLGAIIGSGTCILLDLAVQNRELEKKMKEKESSDEVVCTEQH